jgi:hypothetical protein
VVVGAKTKPDFLVQEGHIGVEALVRYIHSGRGVGLKITAVRNGEPPMFATLKTDAEVSDE